MRKQSAVKMIFRNSYFSAALLLSAGAFLFLSCGFSSVREKDTIYLHMSAEPGTLNPLIATDAYESEINKYVYETLLDRDKNTLDLVPQLAESWIISPDKLSFTFRIRKGVRWSDGVELTSDDVVYSYKTIMDPNVPCADKKVYLIDIASVVALDRYTVRFTYNKLYYRALEICGSMNIIPRHVFDNGKNISSNDANRHPVGTGPYLFDRWDTGKQVVLVRNTNYWKAVPQIRKIVFKIITEPNVAFQMLKKEELDVMVIRPIQWVRQTGSESFNRRFYKLEYYTPNFSFIGWNTKDPLFSDRRVRTAMTMLVNRKEILAKLSYGLGKVATGPFYVNGRDNDQSITPIPFDPAGALKLLEEAGWKRNSAGMLEKNGKPFSFIFTIPAGNPAAERPVTIMKEDMSRVGISLEIRKIEWAVFLKKIDERDYQVVSLGWSLGFDSDPYQLWHSSQIREGSNFVGFSDPEADALIEKVRTTFDYEARIAMYHRLHSIIAREQPYTFLFCRPMLAVVSRRFGNVKVHPVGLDITEWTL
jgi:peptide/nickel transport system substrate-binding protein